MNIIVDTSVLRKDIGFTSSSIQLISKLSKLRLIKLFIPWVVYKEVFTQNAKYIDENIKKITSGIKSLSKIGLFDSPSLDINSLKKDLEVVTIEKVVKQHWEKFVENSNAQIFGIESTHGYQVMKSYFEGLPPFKHKKNREDIPDAFIYESLLTLSKNFNNLYFICCDKNLHGFVKETTSISSLETFEALFKETEWLKVIEKYEEIEHYSDELILIEENIVKISAKAENDILYNVLFTDEKVFSFAIPDDNNEASISDVIEIKELTINKEGILFVDDYFYIPVESLCVLSLEYFLFKSDYYIEEVTREINIIDEDWNDHYFLVDELYEVFFSFKYKVHKSKIGLLEFDFEGLNFGEVSIYKNNN